MIGVVKYSEEFHTATSHKWLGIELQFDMDTTAPLEAFEKAEKAIKEYMSKSIQSAEVPRPDVQVEKSVQVGDLYNQIASCDNIEMLNTYKRRMELLKRDDLKAIWEIKRQEIMINSGNLINEMNKLTPEVEKVRGFK